MLTAFMTGVVAWCLLYGRLPTMLLTLLCIGLALALAWMNRHSHTGFLQIDVLAQRSRLNRVNAALKFWTMLFLMLLCLAARSTMIGISLTAGMLMLTVFAGGLKLHDYIHLLSVPLAFLMLSALALLFEVTSQPVGILNFHLFGLWFCVTGQGQINTGFVIVRALGTVSCLYFLSLTTPVSEIIGVLRRIRCPNVVINLMYLIYRYLFVLLRMHQTMKDAAKSRLGYASCRCGIRTTGSIYTNLLACSYRQASQSFDAMESRCFDEEIRFIENRRRIYTRDAAVSFGICLLILSMTLML